MCNYQWQQILCISVLFTIFSTHPIYIECYLQDSIKEPPLRRFYERSPTGCKQQQGVITSSKYVNVLLIIHRMLKHQTNFIKSDSSVCKTFKQNVNFIMGQKFKSVPWNFKPLLHDDEGKTHFSRALQNTDVNAVYKLGVNRFQKSDTHKLL